MNTDRSAPVVVALDGSPSSRGALHFGIVEARRAGAPLRLVHVHPGYLPVSPMLPMFPGDSEIVATALVEGAAREARRLDEGLDVTTVIVGGSQAHEILRQAEDARLLVMGRETQHGFERWWPGATTLRVAERVGCPLAAVPDSWSEHGPTHDRVVVGLHSPAHAAEVLEHGFAVASERDATLVVVHAWSIADPYLDRIEGRTHADEWVDRGRRLVDDLVAQHREAYPHVPVETRVVHASPARALADAASAADLLVLVRRRNGFTAGRLGTTSKLLLGACPTPVLLVPSGTTPPQAAVQPAEAASKP